MISRRHFLAAATAAGLGVAHADKRTAPFTTSDDGRKLTVMEHGKPVFAYNYAPVEPPEGVAQRFRRANYLHPVYSPDGNVVTDDFPTDHFHHRGVFWAWPNCVVNERSLNVWELSNGRSVFQRWSGMDSNRKLFRIQAQSVWAFDDDGFAPVEERVWMLVHPAKDRQRALDFELTFKNVCDQQITFQGSTASAGSAGSGQKGYGGFCYRPDAGNKPFTFTAADGIVGVDKMSHETPWADISWGGAHKCGVAIFQHPDNPGYPHPGWIFRHYGFLGASWPHTATHVLEPGNAFTLRYRLLIHEGDAREAGVRDAAAAFAKAR